MSDVSGTAKEISLGDDLGDVVVKVNGATVEVRANGTFGVHKIGGVEVYTDAAVNDSGRAAPTTRAKPSRCPA